jgi:hypothetical protein
MKTEEALCHTVESAAVITSCVILPLRKLDALLSCNSS